MQWLKGLFRSEIFTTRQVEKKLNRFCKKYQKIKKIGCKDCPVEVHCHRFLVATPNLYYALIDAEAALKNE